MLISKLLKIAYLKVIYFWSIKSVWVFLLLLLFLKIFFNGFYKSAYNSAYKK